VGGKIYRKIKSRSSAAAEIAKTAGNLRFCNKKKEEK
jgi:hypothetical protein